MQKKEYSWNPSTCIYESSKSLKSVADTSVIKCDEIIYVMDFVSTKMTNTTSVNAVENCHSDKLRYKLGCYILHAVLLITIICYNYAKHGSKQNDIDGLTI